VNPGLGAEGQHEWGGKGGQQETQPLGDGKSGTRLVSIAQGELRIGRPGSWLLKNRGRLLILHHPIGSFLRTVSNERDDLLQVVVQVPGEDGFMVRDAIAQEPDLFKVVVNVFAQNANRLGRVKMWHNLPQIRLP
jgi:hypothetical protein